MREKQMLDGQARDCSDTKAKLPYTKPTLTEWGTVTELTQCLGMTLLTDSNWSGSMEQMCN